MSKNIISEVKLQGKNLEFHKSIGKGINSLVFKSYKEKYIHYILFDLITRLDLFEMLLNNYIDLNRAESNTEKKKDANILRNELDVIFDIVKMTINSVKQLDYQYVDVFDAPFWRIDKVLEHIELVKAHQEE